MCSPSSSLRFKPGDCSECLNWSLRWNRFTGNLFGRCIGRGWISAICWQAGPMAWTELDKGAEAMTTDCYHWFRPYKTDFWVFGTNRLKFCREGLYGWSNELKGCSGWEVGPAAWEWIWELPG